MLPAKEKSRAKAGRVTFILMAVFYLEEQSALRRLCGLLWHVCHTSSVFRVVGESSVATHMLRIFLLLPLFRQQALQLTQGQVWAGIPAPQIPR